jgi:non-specific serine/threonine protein kinase
MEPERWRRIEAAFQGALALGPDERSAFLDEACAGDTGLRREVEELLAAYAASRGILERRPALDAGRLADAVWRRMSPDRSVDTRPASPIVERRRPKALSDASRRASPVGGGPLEEDPEALVGATIDGLYRIEGLVGKGGMGAVYRAVQLPLGRAVALKVVRGDLLSDATVVERFKREARAIAHLRHPHIVTAHDFGVVPDVGMYLAMELLEGRTLRAELEADGRLPPAFTVEVMSQVCSAAHAAHEAGFVHRDLKPTNIFLERTAGGLVAKVLDFGIAKLSPRADPADTPLTLQGAVLGTPAYMSPEQCLGGELDARSDVYSLGCVLYEMLTGAAPFRAGSAAALLVKHVLEAPSPPSRHRPDVPAGLEAAVMQALAKRPEGRFQTAADFGRALGPPRPVGHETPAVTLEVASLVRPKAPNNLPQPLTSFVGRERRVAELRERLDGARLVTLVGPGGIGKTRLALEAASELLGEYPDGAFVVELATASDPELVPRMVAGALGVREEPDRSLVETLGQWLGTKRLLLVLDNCEHLIGACAVLADALLGACPSLRLLATSRESVGVAGEVVWPVPTLSVPDPNAVPPLAGVSEYEATRLFLDRAMLARPGFKVTERDAAAVVRICQHLDGIPLAIELAAARAKALSTEQILAKMDDLFRLLAGGGRTALPRQRTLQATIDWSYDLLSADERRLLARLSVFAGGWGVEAAEEVVSCELRVASEEQDEGARAPGQDSGLATRNSQLATSLAAHDVLDGLTRLVDKSLVVAERHETGTRYNMLETIRRYAGEKLRESGEAPALAARHLDWFLRLAELAEGRCRGPEQGAWFSRLEAELDNLRAALAWSCGEGARPHACLRLCGALGRFWEVHAHLSEGRRWIETALSVGRDEPAALRARALHAGGILALRQGGYEHAKAALEQSAELWRGEGARRELAETLRVLGFVEQLLGDYDRAGALYAHSLDVFREDGDLAGIARTVGDLGLLAMDRGDHVRAAACFEESLSANRRLGDERGVATQLHNLGEALHRTGDHRRAAALVEESLALSRALGSRHLTAYSLHLLGNIANGLGESGRALSLFAEALSADRELGDDGGVAYVLEGLACTWVARGDPERALRLIGAAAALREAIKLVPSPAEQAWLERYAGSAREMLGAGVSQRALAEGRALGLERAVAHALEVDGA